MNQIQRLSLINIALNRCTPTFRSLVEEYFSGKSYKEMLRFLCLLEEFGSKHVPMDMCDAIDFVPRTMSANNMSAGYLMQVLDSNPTDMPKYNRAWQCWSVLDDISYLYDTTSPGRSYENDPSIHCL